jgi:hypothetical protein
VLAAGVEAISALGLTVSLEHLSFEGIIQDANVSRSSAYRRWPYKDLFFADLLLELARSTDLGDDGNPLLVDALQMAAQRRNNLRTDAGRRGLVVDMLHRALQLDVEAVYSAPRWRTYIALNATFAGLPDGDLRSRIGDALKATERRFTAQRAAVLARVVPLMGYRLVEPLQGIEGYEMMAYAVGSTYTGLVVRALSDPELLKNERTMQPFGASQPGEWSVAAYLAASAFLSFVEPDPTVVWNEARISGVLAAIERVADSGTADVLDR